MCLAYSADGRRLASASWDGSIRLWSTSDGTTTRIVRTGNAHATSVAFVPDGHRLAAGFCNDRGREVLFFGSFAVFPCEPGRIDGVDSIHPTRTWIPGGVAGIRKIAMHPRGQAAIVLGMLPAPKESIRVCDLEDRFSAIAFRQDQAFEGIALRSDGRELAAITRSNASIQLWRIDDDVKKIEPSDSVNLSGELGEAVAYSPDGETIAAMLYSGRMFWWPADGPWEGRIRPGHGSPARALAFSPDGRSLLTGGLDGMVHLWDSASQSRRETWDWEIGAIESVCFAPDGLTAAAGGDGVIMIWDIER